jgi:Recombination endonuclease VII
VTDEEFMSQPVEVSPETKRKRGKYHRYPKPIGTDAEWQAILDIQGGTCALCDDTEDRHRDHSYRSRKARGWLCRRHNTFLSMGKDSPALLKKALAYLQHPPAKALGLGESERERGTR